MLSLFTTRHWLISAIVLLVIGIVLGIGGCVIAAVGFGLSAKDMYDYMNLSMRIIGMVMVAFAILPLAVSICCWIFYSWSKREDKKASSNPQAFVISKEGAMPMTEYPYSASAATDTRIYKPQQPTRYGNMDADDSLTPLNFSDATSRYPPDTSSPQVMTSASSFDEDPTVAKARRPKKGKKSRQQELATSVDEKQEMVGYSSAAGSSYRT